MSNPYRTTGLQTDLVVLARVNTREEANRVLSFLSSGWLHHIAKVYPTLVYEDGWGGVVGYTQEQADKIRWWSAWQPLFEKAIQDHLRV